MTVRRRIEPNSYRGASGRKAGQIVTDVISVIGTLIGNHPIRTHCSRYPFGPRNAPLALSSSQAARHGTTARDTYEAQLTVERASGTSRMPTPRRQLSCSMCGC
ncbi:hypothetical protein EXIGLDRAFT_729376 [Exidia glandulosa HHB12029]|uniref:Uncharacterized protein n=1 Tax=Exidia glandulosa HHB12029 TaxID=1314781 RepID=A0A165CKJ3_EXIGL|nr:hypothetical protein EXIGLDRAFT_729376 [Exidia glandulosa HHB12029]